MLLNHNYQIGSNFLDTSLLSLSNATKDFLSFFLDVFSIQESFLDEFNFGYSNQKIYDGIAINYNFSQSTINHKIKYYSIDFFDYGLNALSSQSIPINQIFINNNGLIRINRQVLINLGDNLEDIFASILHHLDNQSLIGVKVTYQGYRPFLKDGIERIKDSFLLTINLTDNFIIDLDNLI